MKLEFSKEGENTITKIIDEDNKKIEFDYITMVKMIYSKKQLDSSDFIGSFSEEEKNGLEQMVREISLKASEKLSD